MDDPVIIGARIKERREALGLSLADVGAEIGVASSTIHRYERGAFKDIKLPVIGAIASVLHVNPQWLIGNTDDPIDYDDGDLLANIPDAYLKACNGDVKKAVAMMKAADQDVTKEQKSKLTMPQYQPTHCIPILGRISAGLPLYADEQVEGYTHTELNGGAEYFALRVSGDSMNAARIQEGDLLIVRRMDIVNNGDIAVVLVGDEDATVKRFYQEGNTVTLMPQSTNPEHQPQVYDTRKTRIRIQGKVVKIEITV